MQAYTKFERIYNSRNYLGIIATEANILKPTKIYNSRNYLGIIAAKNGEMFYPASTIVEIT